MKNCMMHVSCMSWESAGCEYLGSEELMHDPASTRHDIRRLETRKLTVSHKEKGKLGSSFGEMSGFDVAAGAVGFASLGVLLLQGCVQGFILLSTAQNFGQDADLIRCEIEFEQYRLFRWAEKVGLEAGSSKSPNCNLNWELINKFLRQLSSLMTETSKFKEEYGLELITTDDELSTADLEKPRKGLRKLIANVKPDFHNETARSLQKGINIWRRMKWAAIDKAGIAVLINDIRSLVDKLYDLLLDSDREFIRNGIEALLRHVVSQASTPTDLASIEQLLSPKYSVRSKFEESAVKTALGLKQKRLMLGFSEDNKLVSVSSSSTNLSPSSSSSTLVSSRPVSPGPRKPMTMRGAAPRGPLSHKLLKRISASTKGVPARELATYDSASVLVEWKIVDRGLETKLKHRIKTLAALLYDVESSSFHSLNCMGFLKDPGTGNYGYLFKLPEGAVGTCMSLTDVLALNTMTPSLNDRIELSIALVETILQLHTSGWLHKGLRSENILFFPQKESSVNITHPFLEGYEYARADNPSDMTESPALQQEANMYRHPALLRQDRESFRKAFDLYALGCVLIEIGLWTGLTTVLLHFLHKEKTAAKSVTTRIPSTNLTYKDKSEIAEINLLRAKIIRGIGAGSIGEGLEFAAGRRFADIVQVCLSAGDVVRGSDDDNEDEDEEENDYRCIDVELGILESLRSCRL